MTTQEIVDPPSTLRLYGRAAASLARRDRGSGDDPSLPDDEVVRPDIALDRDHLAAYARVCGFRVSDRLPPTYLHVAAFPLSLILLTDDDFPYPLPGMVHIANRITLHRAVTVTERPTLRVRLGDPRPHPSGTQLDVVAHASIDGETVWEDVSTYLHRGSGGAGTAERPGPEDAPERAPGAPTIDVPSDTGRRYAAVSGDRNPIHLHPLTARAFGFPRAIAHGMWTKARVLAALEGRLPERYEAAVRFERPVLLPGRVALTSDTRAGVRRLAVHDATSDRRHLTGEVDPT